MVFTGTSIEPKREERDTAPKLNDVDFEVEDTGIQSMSNSHPKKKEFPIES